MPTQMMHVAIAKKVNEKLELEQDLLYVGCLMTNWTNVEYHISHFKKATDGIEGLSNPDDFYNKYQNKLNDPIVIGYLIHILTDRFWNKYMLNNVYLYNEEKEVIGVKTKKKKELNLPEELIYELKAKTYNKYDNYLLGKNLVDLIKDKIFEMPNLDEIKITQEELDQKIDEYNKLVNNAKKKRMLKGMKNNKNTLLNQKEFENNLERCAGYIYSYLKEKDIIEI